MKALIGTKIGMTQIFDSETGKVTPVTILDVSENIVAKVFKKDDKVSKIEIGKGREKKSNKADLGNYKHLKYVPKYKEVINYSDEIEQGNELKADLFKEGDKVDVSGVSKGKGFTGVIKRWGFKGGKRTHGQSDRERAPGSIGAGTTMGRVTKGLKMAGRHGRANRTIKNLKVITVDSNNNTIAVGGSIPGFKGFKVVIKKAD